MISVHFASGLNGEFGNKGKLPWGSYPEELAFFWASVETEAALGSTLLVGESTFLGLPGAVQNRLSMLFVDKINLLSSKNNIDHLDTGINYACIGGATILNHMIRHHSIDKAYISLIHTVDGSPMEHDTVLDILSFGDKIEHLQCRTRKALPPNGNFLAVTYKLTKGV